MGRLKGGHWAQYEGPNDVPGDDVNMEGEQDRHDGEEEEEWEKEVANTLASLASIHVEEG